jgi:hypothetical protein
MQDAARGLEWVAFFLEHRSLLNSLDGEQNYNCLQAVMSTKLFYPNQKIQTL